MRKLTEYAKKMRDNPTQAEAVFWDYARCKGFGFEVERQVPYGKRIIDFYVKRIRLAIEIDGGYHTTEEQKLKDKERTKELEAGGVTIIRFSNEHVLNDMRSVESKVKQKYLSLMVERGVALKMGTPWPPTCPYTPKDKPYESPTSPRIQAPLNSMDVVSGSPMWGLKLDDLFEKPMDGKALTITWAS